MSAPPGYYPPQGYAPAPQAFHHCPPPQQQQHTNVVVVGQPAVSERPLLRLLIARACKAMQYILVGNACATPFYARARIFLPIAGNSLAPVHEKLVRVHCFKHFLCAAYLSVQVLARVHCPTVCAAISASLLGDCICTLWPLECCCGNRDARFTNKHTCCNNNSLSTARSWFPETRFFWTTWGLSFLQMLSKPFSVVAFLLKLHFV